MDRRAFIKRSAVATAGLSSPTLGFSQTKNKTGKHIIVAGGGIAGLSTAYELMKRGHDVTVLEASRQAGGHVRTMHNPLDDGLYADIGAEQCTKPGYEIYRAYAKEFGLELLPYPRRVTQITFIKGKPHTEDMLRDPMIIQGLGYNKREAAYISDHGMNSLPNLYYAPYLDTFEDEYKPLNIGLDELDDLAVKDLLIREKASNKAVQVFGSTYTSALQALWNAAILKHRGVPVMPTQLFRIKGGNQRMTDAFAKRLGKRVRLHSPITKIEQSDSGVNIHFSESGQKRSMTADYLVNTIPLAKLQQMTVEPAWSEKKTWVIQNTTYDFQSRVVFQARTPFWKREGHSPNMACRHRHLYLVWEMAEEVAGDRSILIGTTSIGTTPEQALQAYHQRYPGKAVDIERTFVHHWLQDPWAPFCERKGFGVGKLRKFWPEILRPYGRIHFAGAYADNLNWGQEAATRSAHRVTREIDETS